MTEISLSRLFEAAREALVCVAGQSGRGTAGTTVAADRAATRLSHAMAAMEAAETGALRELRRLGADLERLTERCRGLTELLDCAPHGHLTTDSSGEVLSANDEAAALLGHRGGAPLGRGIGDLFDEASQEALAAMLRDAAQGHLQGANTLLLAPADGSMRYLEAVSMAVPALEGVTVVHWLFRDVSARALMAEHLRDAQRLELVGRLAGGIAHEFNNLLMIINGQAQFILDALDEDSPMRADIEEIREAGGRAADLTGQLLAYSRKEGRRLRVLDLNEVLDGMARMLRRLIGEDVHLDLDLDRLPTPVRADQGQVEQIVMNLAINARDAMPTGGWLRLATGRQAVEGAGRAADLGLEPGEYATLLVQDSGQGMSPEVQAHLFEPFFTTKTRGRGTGLGLVLVHGLVEQFGGAITISSEVGVGSTFTIYLPMVTGKGDGYAPAQRRVERLPEGDETILVVEDDPLVRRMTVRMLGRLGYTVLEASGAPSALELLDRTRRIPDLLLTDVIMPGESGRDLAKRLLDRLPGLRVLYMSGYPREKLGAHGIVDPGIRVLEKPFTIRRLAVRLREVLDEPRALEASGHNGPHY